MTQGTDEGGTPAEAVASRTKSGDGPGVDEGPFLSLIERPDESTEYEIITIEEQKAAEWAELNQQGLRLDWAGVGICQTDMVMNDFLDILRERYNIELKKNFANKLRHLGRFVTNEVVPYGTTYVNRIHALPVTTAILVSRHEDWKEALIFAEKNCQKALEDRMKRAKIALADPLMPLELRPWNVWNFTTRTPGQGESGYEWGAMCGQIIEHLLWYYTEPGDLVIDPMAGTGVTYDACKRMQREPRCFDKTPTRPEIDKRDVYDGLPEKIAQLVFLDPPYFDIMENEFQSYDEWLDFLGVCVSHAQYALKPGGYLALILKNKCILRDNPKYALIGDAYEILAAHEGLEFENMILTPLPNQLPGFKVNRAKEERTMLNLARLIWVFRRGA